MKTLIVEDRGDDRRLLRYNLEHHGWQVMEAGDGIQALELMIVSKPDLVISDALMPRMDGFELLRRMKNDPVLRDIHFIFYSAVYTGYNERELARSLGADAYLIKPLNPHEFWQQLEEAINGLSTGAERPKQMAAEQEAFLSRYPGIVATKLEEKVRELKAVKEKWVKTFAALHDMVILMDQDKKIIQANASTCRFFETTEDELRGKSCEIFCGKDYPCKDCPGDRTMADGGDHSAEIYHKHLRKTFEVSSSAVPDEDGKLDYLVYVITDVTERKRLEEELFQAHKMEAMGTLAGGIAHDFNNILTAVLGYSELAKDEALTRGLSSSYLDEVITATLRARDMVEQILSFSHKKIGHLQPIAPHLIIEEALKLLRSSMPSSVNIRTRIDCDCGKINGDPTKLHQIVVNLCTNALKALDDEKGVVDIQLCRRQLSANDLRAQDEARPGPFAELLVRDNGCGMSKATKQHMFEPYFTTREVGQGTGLGLSIVYGLARSMGGIVRVQSQPGVGSEFRILFPVLPAADERDTAPIIADLPMGTERIMVVDDEKMIAELQKALLEKQGYKVTALTSSNAALKLFSADPKAFDLLLTDQTMPEISGHELAAKFLALRPNFPIILCTGYSSIISKKQALEMGIKLYIHKPVQRCDLVRFVRDVLDNM
ncbi:MAG TPA: response regulator [Desulfobacterales bacterium]|nr:response regulator [Desulfobacterales bacterium]